MGFDNVDQNPKDKYFEGLQAADQEPQSQKKVGQGLKSPQEEQRCGFGCFCQENHQKYEMGISI